MYPIYSDMGTVNKSDGRCTAKVKCSIFQAEVIFQNMMNILCNKHLSVEIRKQVLHTCYIKTILR